MSIISQKSRDLHDAWQLLRTPEGAERYRQHAVEELASTRSGRWARWTYRNPKKTFAVTLMPPLTLLSGSGVIQATVYDSWIEMVSATSASASTMEWLGFAMGLLGVGSVLVSSPFINRSHLYEKALDSSEGACEASRGAYLLAVREDLNENGYTVSSMDSRTGTFVTYRGVVMAAEDDEGMPVLLLNGAPLIRGYENIESSSSVKVKGLDGSRLALSGPPRIHNA